jgi:transcriptional regulator with XRE-family HTH domain
VRIARGRAGLTQQQLADRSGHPRETIARWESGAREPSLSSLLELAEAANLELVVHLAEQDSSLGEAVEDQLVLTPAERLARLLPRSDKENALKALRWLAGSRTPAIVIGGMAAALQGAPQRPAGGQVEFVSGDPGATEDEIRAAGLVAVASEDRWADTDARSVWRLPDGGTLAIASNVPGTGDYRDLRRSAQTFDIDAGTSVAIAHPRDLLRMADASPRETERARAPGLRALLARLTQA